MTHRGSRSRLVALGLVFTLHAGGLPLFSASPPSTLSGTVFAAGRSTPLAGARLHVADPRTGRLYTTPPTSTDGGFELADLPPAVYRLGVEIEGGLFLVDQPLSLEAGQLRTVTLQLGQAEPEPEPDPESEAKTKKKKAGVWDNPLTASLIILGGAIVVGYVVNELTDDSPTVSPSGG